MQTLDARESDGRGRTLGWVAALLVAMLSAAAQPASETPPEHTLQIDNLERRVETLSLNGLPAIDVRVLHEPDWPRGDDVIEAATDAVQRFSAWYGPLDVSGLTIVAAPWSGERAEGADVDTASDPEPYVVVTARWLTSADDVSLEREVIGAIAREYWRAAPSANAESRWFTSGVALYSAARAIDEAAHPLHESRLGRHRQTYRFFGGFVPHTLRELPLARTPDDPRPPITRFEEIERADLGDRERALRSAAALHTLERYIGWPAMQQALAALFERQRHGPVGPADFAAIVSEQRGADLHWFFDAALPPDTLFDYFVDAFATSRMDDGRFSTTITVRRRGDGHFAAASEESRALTGGRIVAVTTRFEDGSEVREWWDDREPVLEVSYISRSPAVSAEVDPDGVILLDADRTNNARRLEERFSTAGARMTLLWLAWLQDLVLTWSALV